MSWSREMDCFWCIKDSNSNIQAVKKLCSIDELALQLLHDMKKDMTDCYDCVLAYHDAKDVFLVKHEKAEKELLAWEVDRLSSHLESILYSKARDDIDVENIDYLFQEDTMPAFFGFGDGVELQSKLSIPLQEILNFPYLLWNKDLAKLAVKGLLSLEEAGSPLIVDGKLPGIYLLLIHPSDKVRKWARKSVNFLGSVSCDDYDDISGIVKWIMGVYNFGLFQSPDIGNNALTQSSYTILPSHLFVQNPVKEFWLGVCMLLKALEVNTIRLQLVSRDHHPEFVRVVVNALDHENSVNKKTAQGPESEFWPILHCFIILLERLGSRIWQHILLPDAMRAVFYLIANHPAYRDELMHWPGFRDVDPTTSSTSDEFEDSLASSSQMVYNWDGRRRSSFDLPLTRNIPTQSGKRKTVVFAMFKPYLKSVMDFGDVGNNVVKKLIKYLHYLKEEFQIATLGYESIMSAMMGCLDLLLKGSLQSLLPMASDLWIKDVIEILSSKSLEISRCRKLAMAFCKTLLERLSKIHVGTNVANLLESFHKNNLSNLDILIFKELLEKHFKGNCTSPSLLPRFFERERRMVLIPGKKSRQDMDTSDIDRSSSEEQSFHLPLKQKCKFIMLPKCRTSEVSMEIEKIIRKKPCATVSPRQQKQSSKGKEKSILDYCNRSPLLDARVPVRKLSVRRKSDEKGNLSDALVVDDSNEKTSDDWEKGDSGGSKFNSPKLSLKSKKKPRKAAKKESITVSSSMSSLDSLNPSNKKITPRKFYGKGAASIIKTEQNSLEVKDELQEFFGDFEEDDEFLKGLNHLIDVNVKELSTKKSSHGAKESFDQSIEESQTKFPEIKKEIKDVKTATVNRENKKKLSMKMSKDCIVISDDSSPENEVDDVVVPMVTNALEVQIKEENGDNLWNMLSGKVKDEPNGSETELIVSHVKTEMSDAVSNLDPKQEVKIEVDYPDIKIEPEIKDEKKDIELGKSSATWSPPGQRTLDREFCFNGDDNWDVMITDFNDPLDTMTCIEADLNELPDEDEVLLISDENELPDEDKVLLISDEDEKSDVNDDVVDDVGDDVVDDDDVTMHIKRERHSSQLSSSVDGKHAETEGGKVSMNPDDVRQNNTMSTDAIPSVSDAGCVAVVSDSSSPEQLKGNCFGAMLSKLKFVMKKANALGASPQREATSGDDGDVIDDVGKMVETNEKDEGKEVKRDENGGVPSGDGDKSASKDIDVVENKNVEENVKEGNSGDSSVCKESIKIGIVQPVLKKPPEKRNVRFDTLPPPAQILPRTVKGSLPASKKSVTSPLLRVIETKPKHVLTVDEFYRKVLNWDANLLYKTPIVAPKIIHGGKVCLTFNNMDDYYKVFKPLILMDVWAQLTRDWSSHNVEKQSMIVDSVNSFQAHFQLIQCKKRLPVEGNQSKPFLQENTLVAIEIKEGVEPTRVFALVERMSRERGQWQPGDEQWDGSNHGGQCFEFTITLRMLATARRLVARETLHCIVVTSLVTYIRQWTALMFLPRSLLARDILSPRPNYCGTNDLVNKKDAPQNPEKGLGYNGSQFYAIERTTEALRKPYPIPRTCFIQGPPGTGKSHTIIGLIKKYLKNRSTEVQTERENQLPGSSSTDVPSRMSGRILLCAPSNAAIDVLVRRLVADMRSNEGNLGCSKGKNCGSINLVRIGRFSSIHPQVLPFTLDVLCKTELAKLSAGDMTKEETVKADLQNVRAKIDQLEKKSYALQCAGPSQQHQVNDLSTEINALVKKKHHIERDYGKLRARSKCRKQQEAKIKKDVLFSADIVCCTLSGSGSQFLLNNLLKNQRNCPPFGCVIVDEACQSCELDVLIPLQFGCSKLVLVGDPEQLRTTILSQEAQKLQFGQSLFERHFRVFRERAKKMGLRLQKTKDNPIQMLDIQYRMHPDICAFPSSRVYQGRLKNAKNVLTRQSVCELKPYVVLNVLSGKEQPSPNGSLCNPVECDLVLEICVLLRKSLLEKHFGIVTPYRAQVNLLERNLRERGLEKIEVNTVDGFQGREKEIIIMSCVRANDQAKGIGFLADRQRMNVALTRARHSLVILLNAPSLVTNEHWKACIDDASKRGMLYDVHSPKDIKNAFQNKATMAVATSIRPRGVGEDNADQSTRDMGACAGHGNKLLEVARKENGNKMKDNEQQKTLENEAVRSKNELQKTKSVELTGERNPMNCNASVVSEPQGENAGRCDTAVAKLNSGCIEKPSDPRLRGTSAVIGNSGTGSITREGGNAEGSMSDACKRKYGSRNVTESCGSDVIQGDNRRGEKKRRIENESSVRERSKCDTGNQSRNNEKSRKIDRSYFESRGKEGSKMNTGGGGPSSSLGSSRHNSDEMLGKLDSTSSKRKWEERNKERKRRKTGEIAKNSDSRSPTIPDHHPATPDDPTTSLVQPPIAAVRRSSGSNHTRSVSDHARTVSDRRAVGSSRTKTVSDYPTAANDDVPSVSVPEPAASDDLPRIRVKSGPLDEFDFDEYESGLGTDQSSNCARVEKPSENSYLNEVFDRVVHSGGVFLAQNDPYLSQLATHEQRQKLARSTSLPLGGESAASFINTAENLPAEKEIPRELLRTFSNPTPSTSSTPSHGRAPRSHRPSVLLPTHITPPVDGSSHRQLENVIQRVRANNPTRRPTPVVCASDDLATFRRYHGGPRARVARANDRRR